MVALRKKKIHKCPIGFWESGTWREKHNCYIRHTPAPSQTHCLSPQSSEQVTGPPNCLTVVPLKMESWPTISSCQSPVLSSSGELCLWSLQKGMKENAPANDRVSSFGTPNKTLLIGYLWRSRCLTVCTCHRAGSWKLQGVWQINLTMDFTLVILPPTPTYSFC